MNALLLHEEDIASHIYFIRGQKVMLDSDLAQIYGVETRILNQAVRRNEKRFPEDFMFQLTEAEWENLKSQIATSSGEESLRSQFVTLNNGKENLKSQIVTSKRGQHRKYFPYVFTEHGTVMLASVLNSEQAIQASLFVVRAFVKIREFLNAHKELAKKLEELEERYDEKFSMVFEAIRQLIQQDNEPRKPVGYKQNKK